MDLQLTTCGSSGASAARLGEEEEQLSLVRSFQSDSQDWFGADSMSRHIVQSLFRQLEGEKKDMGGAVSVPWPLISAAPVFHDNQPYRTLRGEKDIFFLLKKPKERSVLLSRSR